MKVITIGRDTDNDVVINDAKVSRHHLQIVSDGGNYRIVDFNSSNGTFVNDRKISGETALFANDIVRIGNTILPWQTYFTDKKTNKSVRYMSIAALFVIILTAGIFIVSPSSKTHVRMIEKNGVRYVPMKINGQELDFVFDTGASSICISTLEALVLIKNGTLNESDIIGEQQFIDASGQISAGTRINLKTVELGGRKLNNIEATVIENPRAECLLGQTVLSHFGKYTIDNQKNKIIFE
jgi:aspartyl protease family protein